MKLQHIRTYAQINLVYTIGTFLLGMLLTSLIYTTSSINPDHFKNLVYVLLIFNIISILFRIANLILGIFFLTKGKELHPKLPSAGIYFLLASIPLLQFFFHLPLLILLIVFIAQLVGDFLLLSITKNPEKQSM